MNTYHEIIRTLFSSEAEKYLSCGTSYSYPVPVKEKDGTLTDSFFLYAVDYTTCVRTSPTAYIGINCQSGSMTRYEDLRPPREDVHQSARPFTLVTRTDIPADPQPMPKSYAQKRRALITAYKRLYPQIRQFAFREELTLFEHKLLAEYFHVQRSLFGSQLEDYRKLAPEFYIWMVRQFAPSAFIQELSENIHAKPSDARDFLNKASGPALIAARSYYPQSADDKTAHAARLEEVRQLARDLRKEYDLPPGVKLDDLAEKLGIRVERKIMDPEIDGYATLDYHEAVITINSSNKIYWARKRFTLAHEIGHVVIPWHVGTTACVTDNTWVTVEQKQLIDSQEQEANVFASELLIPSDWLREQKAQESRLRILLKTIHVQCRTSVLACLHALENVLNPGEVICAISCYGQACRKSDCDKKKCDKKNWWFFCGSGVGGWDSNAAAFEELDRSFALLDRFEKGSYTILHYKRKE